MFYPITQRELTVHLHNKNWYLRPIEDEEKILGPIATTCIPIVLLLAKDCWRVVQSLARGGWYSAPSVVLLNHKDVSCLIPDFFVTLDATDFVYSPATHLFHADV